MTERRSGEHKRLLMGFLLCLISLLLVVAAPWDSVSGWWLAPWGALVLTGTGLLLWDDWHHLPDKGSGCDDQATDSNEGDSS
jgi:hypothetical protein